MEGEWLWTQLGDVPIIGFEPVFAVYMDWGRSRNDNYQIRCKENDKFHVNIKKISQNPENVDFYQKF